jgi:hypothetical protein
VSEIKFHILYKWGKSIVLYILIFLFRGDRKTRDCEENGSKHSPD